MPHRQLSAGHFERKRLSFGPTETVNLLLEQGVIDAQALNWGTTKRLASRLGLEEIERARAEADRIGQRTSRTPLLYGRQIVEVVRVARAAEARSGDEALAQKVEDERARLYERMAQSVGATALDEAEIA